LLGVRDQGVLLLHADTGGVVAGNRGDIAEPGRLGELQGGEELADITAWIAGAGQEVLAAFGCRRDAEGRHVPPHADTVERLMSALPAQQLADGVGAWLAARAGIGPTGAECAPLLVDGR
jgi:hypothetical protein